jgi:uncharacterized protein YndB with AHSA1/START domain
MNERQRLAMTTDTPFAKAAGHQIVSERVFDAPRAWVFAAFSDPELVPHWWGPRGVRVAVEKMDVRPGGAWRFVCRDPDGREDAFRGVYREVVPSELLVQTFEWRRMPDRVLVETFILEELERHTTVTTTLEFDSSDRMFGSGRMSALSTSYVRLDELLANLEPGW